MASWSKINTAYLINSKEGKKSNIKQKVGQIKQNDNCNRYIPVNTLNVIGILQFKKLSDCIIKTGMRCNWELF